MCELSGRDPGDVARVTTQEYAAGKGLAPRPLTSTMRLDRLRATGFEPEDAMAALERYCAETSDATASSDRP